MRATLQHAFQWYDNFFSNRFFSFAFLYMSNNQFFSISRTCWTWFPLVMSYESDIWTQFVCVTKHIECIRFNIFFFHYLHDCWPCIKLYPRKIQIQPPKKRKVEFFSVFVSTHHQFKCCQNKNTNENSHVSGQRLQTEKCKSKKNKVKQVQHFTMCFFSGEFLWNFPNEISFNGARVLDGFHCALWFSNTFLPMIRRLTYIKD